MSNVHLKKIFLIILLGGARISRIPDDDEADNTYLKGTQGILPLLQTLHCNHYCSRRRIHSNLTSHEYDIMG